MKASFTSGLHSVFVGHRLDGDSLGRSTPRWRETGWAIMPARERRCAHAGGVLRRCAATGSEGATASRGWAVARGGKPLWPAEGEPQPAAVRSWPAEGELQPATGRLELAGGEPQLGRGGKPGGGPSERREQVPAARAVRGSPKATRGPVGEVVAVDGVVSAAASRGPADTGAPRAACGM